MKSSRFDALARRLGRTRSRRDVLAAGLAAMATQISHAAAAIDPAARCSSRKPCPVCFACRKRKCRVASDGTPCPTGACRAGQCVCASNCTRKICGDDGCGGSCGSCPAGQLCTAAGTCEDRCPTGQRFCQGACIPVTHCCADADCDGDQTCCPDGACANLQTNALNCGACGAACPINETCVAGVCDCDGRGASAPFTCCPGGGRSCDAGPNLFTNPETCGDFTQCPAGTTACIATAPLNGDSCKVCCPAGSRCNPIGGFCVQQPPADLAARRGAPRKRARRRPRAT